MIAPAAASDGAWRLFWLDYAANARGVLSNPLFGDLKTDLNLTLENPNRVNNSSKHIDITTRYSNINSAVETDWYLYALLDTIAEARAYLFYFHRQAGDEAPNAAIASRYRPYRGTSWTDIWRWYQSYNRLDAAKPTFTTPVRPVPIPVSTHTPRSTYPPGHEYLDHFDLLDYPRFAKIQYVYAYTAQPYGTRPDGSPQYRLGISFVPVVTIWNPFNFRLELPVPTSRGGVSAGMKLGGVPVGFHVGFRRWDAPTGTYGSTNWVTPGSPNLPTQGQRWVHTSFFATQTWVSNFRVGKDGSPSRLWLDPGESVVFTPNLSGDYVKVSAGLDGFNSYPGYEPRFGIVNYGDSLGTSGGILGAVTPVSNWAWTGGADDRVVIQPYYSDHWANQAWGNRETALDFWTDNGWPVQEYRGHFITDFKAVVEGPSGQNTLKLNYNPAKFRSVRLAEALGQKIPFMAMSVYLKSEQGTSAAGRQYPNLAFLHSSLMSRSQTLDRDQVDLLWLRNVGVEFYIDQLFGSWDSDAVQLDINNRGFVGSGLTAENGATFWAGAEQPYWPMISMAQLQNAQMGSPALGAWRTQGTWNSGGAIDFAFGNSVGYVGIPVDAAINSGPTPSPWTTTQTGTRFLIDHAYLANWSGWDYYFCSSLTRQDTLGFGAHGVTRRDLAQVFDEFRRGVARLPNPRLTWIRNTGEADDAAAFARILQPSLVPYVAAGIPAGSSREGDMTQSDSQTKLARNLLQEGVFNVNSASKEAWRALLFASRDKAVAYDGTYEDYYVNRAGYPDITVPSAPKISVETFADGNARTPFPRFSMPLGPCADRTGREEDYWRGFRALTDAQVDALAEEIVKEVKRRGPFLSLAEFVNRRVAPRAAGPNDWFAKQAGRADSTPADTKPETRGALQAALDRTDVNARFNAAGRTYTKAQMTAGDPTLPGMANAYLPVDKLANYPVDDGGSVARAYGSNGFLMQADILNVIGSFLTVRGDTFTIRCLGEAPRGEARAVCEIMVQRLPEYIRHRPDDTTIVGDLPETNYGLLTHLTNKSLGRRFRVVSFRWLSPNEI